MKKLIILSIGVFLFLTLDANRGYEKVDCSVSPTFWLNSCDACFNWWEITTSSNISFLDDIWVNSSDSSRLMYKEEQVMPEMKSLNGSVFTKNPNDDTFWEYTEELESLYKEEFERYVLPPSSQVSWIKSSLWASYNFSSLPNKWEEAWILTFDIKSHNISSEWNVDVEAMNYRECVLYTSWSDKSEEVVEQIEWNEEEVMEETKDPVIKEVTKVRAWSPLFLIYLIFSLFIWTAILKRKRK